MRNNNTPCVLVTLALALVTGGCGGNQVASADAAQAALAEANDETALPTGGLLTQGIQRFAVNDVEVILKQTVGNPIVRIGIFVETGSADWNVAEGGAALSLGFGALSDGGPSTIDRDTYLATLEAIGSSIGGAPSYDFTSVSMQSVAPFWEQTWELFAETMRDPALREGEFERARERQLAALRTRFDDPDSAVVEVTREGFFANHAYAADPDGTEAGLLTVTADDARAAIAGLWSNPARITVVAVGNVGAEALAARVGALFAPTDVGDLSGPSVPDPLVRDGGSVAYLERADLPTNYILGYFAAPAVAHEDYPALEVALSILDHRLFEEVRTRRNLSYAVSAGLGSRRANSGYLYVTAADPNTTLQVMFDTVDAMIATPVSEQDLADQIEAYLTGYYIALQSNSAQASLLASWEILGGGMEAADAHVDRLRAVTPQQVSEALDRYVRNIHFGVVGDPAAIDEALFTSR